MITREQFARISNCPASLDFVASQSSLSAAWENCERPDWLLDFARKAGIASKEQFVRAAIGEAEAVLHIWTAKYPDDDRPQKAIKAAKACLGNQTPERSAAAAYAAYAAADASDVFYNAAVYDAADAADAAYNAAAAAAAVYTATTAHAAAAAAAAAANAAFYDAAYAAASADDKDAFLRSQCDRIRAIIPNPFINQP